MKKIFERGINRNKFYRKGQNQEKLLNGTDLFALNNFFSFCSYGRHFIWRTCSTRGFILGCHPHTIRTNEKSFSNFFKVDDFDNISNQFNRIQ